VVMAIVVDGDQEIVGLKIVLKGRADELGRRAEIPWNEVDLYILTRGGGQILDTIRAEAQVIARYVDQDAIGLAGLGPDTIQRPRQIAEARWNGRKCDNDPHAARSLSLVRTYITPAKRRAIRSHRRTTALSTR